MRCVIKKWGFGGTAPEKSLRTLDPLTLSLSRRERELDAPSPAGHIIPHIF